MANTSRAFESEENISEDVEDKPEESSPFMFMDSELSFQLHTKRKPRELLSPGLARRKIVQSGV